MRDITETADIEILLESFYRKVMKDDVIGFFFTDTVPFDLETHIPVLVSFWETILLGKNSYSGNPMDRHFELNRLRKLEQQHFDRWLKHWTETVGELFSGKVADEAISRAQSIAGIMSLKMTRENSK